MKKLNILALLLVTANAYATPGISNRHVELEEIPLTKAFVPPMGFDDNDTVQFVVTGYLPNACYQLAETVVTEDREHSAFRIKQKAIRNTEGICAEIDSLPAHLLVAVPFTNEVNVGRLNAGEYTVLYDRNYQGNIAPEVRSFSVSPALRPSVDNVQYAAVSDASMSDVERSDGDIFATIAGSLTSSCTELNSDIYVSKRDDVVVVLPGVSVSESFLCAFVLRPFERVVNLGRFIEGSYLLHVRSMSGRAVNKVFSVQGSIGGRR